MNPEIFLLLLICTRMYHNNMYNQTIVVINYDKKELFRFVNIINESIINTFISSTDKFKHYEKTLIYNEEFIDQFDINFEKFDIGITDNINFLYYLFKTYF